MEFAFIAKNNTHTGGGKRGHEVGGRSAADRRLIGGHFAGAEFHGADAALARAPLGFDLLLALDALLLATLPRLVLLRCGPKETTTKKNPNEKRRRYYYNNSVLITKKGKYNKDNGTLRGQEVRDVIRRYRDEEKIPRRYWPEDQRTHRRHLPLAIGWCRPNSFPTTPTAPLWQRWWPTRHQSKNHTQTIENVANQKQTRFFFEIKRDLGITGGFRGRRRGVPLEGRDRLEAGVVGHRREVVFGRRRRRFQHRRRVQRRPFVLVDVPAVVGRFDAAAADAARRRCRRRPLLLGVSKRVKKKNN